MGLAEHLIAAVALGIAARSARFRESAPRIPTRGDPSGLPSLSVIVPARNEEGTIEGCVRSLCAQTLRDYEIVVVDDRSTDETRAILRRLETEFSRLRVLDGNELPAGWAGKPWALHQGESVARGEWLLFTDADVRFAPEAAASALRYALDNRLDALSLLWELKTESFWEAAVIPHVLATIVFALGPVALINDPSRRDRAAATGAFILVRKTALEAIGGHAALRAEVVDDVELARLIKRDPRFHFCLGEGRELLWVRMYDSLPAIWNGFSKNFFIGMKGSVPASLAAIVLLSAASWIPLVLAARATVRKRPLDLIESLAASGVIVATSAWGMGVRGLDRRLGFTAPLGLAVLAAIVANSTIRVLSGRGVDWRGRTYHPFLSSRA